MEIRKLCKVRKNHKENNKLKPISYIVFTFTFYSLNPYQNQVNDFACVKRKNLYVYTSIILGYFLMNKFTIEDLVFNIINLDNNEIMVEHNSHIADKINSNEKIEQKNLDNGIVLYKSSLFCSLVSLLRYIKINKISYKFLNDIISIEKSDEIKFVESTEKIKFIDQINSMIKNYDWYGKYKIVDSNNLDFQYKSRLELLKNNNNI